jgi:hypothetical protein
MDVIETVFEVLDGKRVPIRDGDVKVLCFVLKDPSGCDALVSRSHLEISYGWHPARHTYAPECAPPVLSELLAWGGVLGPVRRVRTILRPRDWTGPAGMSWSSGRRFLWVDAEEGNVTFHVRDAMSGILEVPAETPRSVSPDPRFVRFSGGLECPQCHALAEEYRWLHAGGLICGACGRSFDEPAGAKRGFAHVGGAVE